MEDKPGRVSAAAGQRQLCLDADCGLGRREVGRTQKVKEALTSVWFWMCCTIHATRFPLYTHGKGCLVF